MDMAMLECIRAESFADDLEITDEMLEWSEAAVRGMIHFKHRA